MLFDLVGRLALVVSVVPLGQVGIDRRDAQSGELGGASSPDARTAHHGMESHAPESNRQRRGLAFAIGSQRQIGVGGVSPGGTPLGLPMPDEDEAYHIPILSADCNGWPAFDAEAAGACVGRSGSPTEGTVIV